MEHAASTILSPWQNFYVIIGSAAAGLTGLVFVVITIVSGSERAPRSHEGTATFTTPTIVHFGAALLAAAVLSVPWPSLFYVAVLLGLVGFSGVAYMLNIAYRIRRMATYDADTEDWIWHTLMPLLAYGAMLGASAALPLHATQAMFAFAFAAIALVFTGLHNAWDIVTFIAVDSREAKAPDAPETEKAPD